MMVVPLMIPVNIAVRALCRIVKEIGFDWRISDKYEDLPKEWLHESEFGHLCPDCALQFRLFMTTFFDGKLEYLAAKWKTNLDY